MICLSQNLGILKNIQTAAIKLGKFDPTGIEPFKYTEGRIYPPLPILCSGEKNYI